MDKAIREEDVINAISDWVKNGETHSTECLIKRIRAIEPYGPFWAINQRGEKVAFDNVSVNKVVKILEIMSEKDFKKKSNSKKRRKNN